MKPIEYEYTISFIPIIEEKINEMCLLTKQDFGQVLNQALLLLDTALQADEVQIIKNNEITKIILK